MQRIINGVAQQVLGTCRCPQCAGHTGNAVRTFGRRTVNGRPRYTGSSTYWLSGIFAAAATFDAGQKIRRRDKWEEAIADKKRELDADVSEEVLKTGIPETSDTCHIPSFFQEDEQQAHGNTRILLSDDAARGHRPVHLQKRASNKDREATNHKAQHYTVTKHNAQHYTATNHKAQYQTATNHQDVRHQSTTRKAKTHKDHKAEFLAEMQNPQRYSIVNPGDTLLDQVKEKEQWPTTQSGVLKQHCLAPESIYLPDGAGPQKRRYQTPKKNEIISLATKLLQMTILLHIHETQNLVDVTSMPTEIQDILKLDQKKLLQENGALITDLHTVWKAPSNLSGYERRTPEIIRTYYPQRGAKPVTLNQQLYSNFVVTRRKLREDALVRDGHTAKDNIPAILTMLAKTAWLLGESHLLPDLTTYNILVAGFSDHNLKTLTHHTIATLRRCQLRPNETTVATVLQHYSRYGDKLRFTRWIDMLNGKHSGLALSRHQTIERSHLKTQLMVKQEEPNKVIQLQRASPKVLSAIIAGTLQFDGIDAALIKCRTLGVQQWGMCMDTFGPLLRDCAHRLDTDNAVNLWSLVCDFEVKAKRAEHFSSKPEPIPKHVFAAMLDLHQRSEDQEGYARVAEHAKDVWPGEMQSILDINAQDQGLLAKPSFAFADSASELRITNTESSKSLQDASSRENAAALDASYDDGQDEMQSAYAAKGTVTAHWQDNRRPSWPRESMTLYAPSSHEAQEQYAML